MNQGAQYFQERTSYCVAGVRLNAGTTLFAVDTTCGGVSLLSALHLFMSFDLLNSFLPRFFIHGHLIPISNLHFFRILTDIIFGDTLISIFFDIGMLRVKSSLHFQ